MYYTLRFNDWMIEYMYCPYSRALGEAWSIRRLDQQNTDYKGLSFDTLIHFLELTPKWLYASQTNLEMPDGQFLEIGANYYVSSHTGESSHA